MIRKTAGKRNTASGGPKRLAVANWKMNPPTVGKAKELFLEIRKHSSRKTNVETVIAAPFTYLAELRKLTTGKHTKLGAQDIFWESFGTYTGEISAPMLASVGVSHVIVGHSERRALGETDEVVAKKAKAAIAGKLTAVVCVGESERDTNGRYLSAVEAQLRSLCAAVTPTMLKQLVVAYEPVWAISRGDGKGSSATPEDVHEMTIFIRKVLTSIYSRPAAERVPLLYGGSVNQGNVDALLADGVVDGFLVGGASLKPEEFSVILSALHGAA